MIKAYPDVAHLSSAIFPSAFVKPTNFSPIPPYVNQRSFVPLRYWKTHLTASQCASPESLENFESTWTVYAISGRVPSAAYIRMPMAS